VFLYYAEEMIFILTGPVHSGKTTLLRKAVKKLMALNVPVSGFLSLALYEGNRILGYDLYEIRTNQSTPFLRKEGQDKWERIGDYFFLPEGLAKAKKIISTHTPSQWLFVDEIGLLELSGKGVWPVLKKVLFLSRPHILIVVRRPVLQDFLHQIRGQDTLIFDIYDKGLLPRLCKKLASLDKSISD
jgi:nucleoside-triphosphatase THEP1